MGILCCGNDGLGLRGRRGRCIFSSPGGGGAVCWQRKQLVRSSGLRPPHRQRIPCPPPPPPRPPVFPNRRSFESSFIFCPPRRTSGHVALAVAHPQQPGGHSLYSHKHDKPRIPFWGPLSFPFLALNPQKANQRTFLVWKEGALSA